MPRAKIPVLARIDLPAIGVTLMDQRDPLVTNAEIRGASAIMVKTLMDKVINVERPTTVMCAGTHDHYDAHSPELNLNAYDDQGDLVGLLVFYNIETLPGTGRGKLISAMPMPGTRKLPGHTLQRTWGMILRRLLGKRLPYQRVPGSVTIEEYIFPVAAGHEWDRQGEDVIAEAAVGRTLERDGRSRPTRLRARG